MKKRGLRILLLSVSVMLLLCVFAAAAPSRWAKDDISQAISEGLLPKRLQGHYQAAITRAEFCELIAPLLPETQGVSFPDCKTSAVSRCAAHGILTGYPDGNFYPKNSLTREQAAAILWRTASVLGMDAAQSALLPAFRDLPDASGYSLGAISWAERNGILHGVSADRFDPKGTYTREQSVITVLRLKHMQQAKPERVIHTADHVIQVFESSEDGRLQRRYRFSDGTEVIAGRTLDAAGKTPVCSIWMPGEATVRIPDGKSWRIEPLSAGRYDGSCCYIDSEGGASCWCYLPQSYYLRDNNSLEYIPGGNGWLEARRYSDGWLLTLMTPGSGAGTSAEYTVFTSEHPLFNWTERDHAAERFMVAYTLNTDGRWCYDGYYYEAPSTYVPSGENYFYRNVSCYFGKSMVFGADAYYGCNVFTQIIVDIMLRQQNAAGYLPSCSVSTWLLNDYGIGGGYYDTRFNSDWMETLYLVYTKSENDEIPPAVKRYFAFYLQHAQEHHRTTANGGWLVDDYSITGTKTETHTSLNHQLAEASALYHWGDLLGDGELVELADRMLQAVFDTTDKWIREDSNLHYSVSPAWVYGETDYPYLTYNDLFQMQKLLVSRGRERSPELDRLMDAKRSWMQKNGVTGYMTS